jgi:iron(III) transport system substrate-binding protein
VKIRFLIVVLLFSALAATACAGPATPTIAVAPTTGNPTAAPAPTIANNVTKTPLKGELNVLCVSTETWCQGTLKEFQTANPGMNAKITRLSSTEALTRMRNEKATPSCDIVWGAPIDLIAGAKKEGLLATYITNAHNNLIDPKVMLDSDTPPNWVAININAVGFATNTKQTLKPPASFDDLAKSDYQNQIAMAHPAFSPSAYTFACVVIQTKGEPAGWDYLKKVAANVSVWNKTDTGVVSTVGRGESAVGIAYAQDIIAGIQESNYPTQMTFPSEGTGYDISGMAIIRFAQHPEPATIWYNWALAPATQELDKKYQIYQGLTAKNAAPVRPELLQVKLANYSLDSCSSRKAAILDKFSSDIAASTLAK